MKRKIFYLLPAILAVACQTEEPQFGTDVLSFRVTEAPLQTKGGDTPGTLTLTSEDGRTIRFVPVEETLSTMSGEVPASTKASKVYGSSDAQALDFAVWAYNMSPSDAQPSAWVTDGGTGNTPVRVSYNSQKSDWRPATDIWFNTSSRTPFSSWYTRWFALGSWAAYSHTSVSVNVSGKTANYTVPSTVSNQWDLMASVSATRAINESSPIDLNFVHVLTGIRFQRDAGLEISHIKLSGVYDSATLDMTKLPADGDLSSYNNVDNVGDSKDLWSNRGRSVSDPVFEMDMVSGDWTDNCAAGDANILMMIPQFTPADASITVTVGGVQYRGDISGHRWLPGRLTTYHLDTWTYQSERPIMNMYFSVYENQLQYDESSWTETVSIRTVSSDGSIEPGGAWKAYFSDTEPSVGDELSLSWSESPLQDEDSNDWLRLSSYSGDGKDNPVTVYVAPRELVGVTQNLMTNASAMTANLRSGPGVSNLDLSRYDILTGSTTGAGETANCYVIKKHGSYLIPCVYGNAFSNGATNPSAFINSSGGQSPLGHFVNADGKPIANAVIPYDDNLTISGTLKARVLWQNVMPGFEIITDDNLEYVSASGTSASCPYIRVTIPRERVFPANIMIALCDDKKVLWSWHLWITDETFSTDNALQSDGINSYDFLSANLGWIPPISYSSGTVAGRQQYAILVSPVTNKVLDAFLVSQPEYTSPEADFAWYIQTYYQWGRKDPMPPASTWGLAVVAYSIPGEKVYYLGNSFVSEIYCGVAEGVTDEEVLGWMVRHPYAFASATSHHYNLWSASVPANGAVKTVYDPSPRGFKVPGRDALSSLTYGSTRPDNLPEEYPYGGHGSWFSTPYSPAGFGIYFPLTSYRVSDGYINAFANMSGYWTSTPSSMTEAYSLDINDDYLRNPFSRDRLYGLSVRSIVDKGQ